MSPETCRVTVYTQHATRVEPHPCGEPAVALGLCKRHNADRERLMRK